MAVIYSDDDKVRNSEGTQVFMSVPKSKTYSMDQPAYKQGNPAMFTNDPNDKNYKRALSEVGTSADALRHQKSSAIQPTAPTDVVSTSGQQPSYYSQMKRATRYNDHINQAGLRASLDPYGSMGFRPLNSKERQGLQQQYTGIANMKGLSNRQRQAFLGEARKQMAQHGMKPQFDLESNKGLSARQIAANQLDRTATDINRVDQVWKQGGAADMHNYNLQKYRDDYQDMLWGRYWE